MLPVTGMEDDLEHQMKTEQLTPEQSVHLAYGFQPQQRIQSCCARLLSYRTVTWVLFKAANLW